MTAQQEPPPLARSRNDDNKSKGGRRALLTLLILVGLGGGIWWAVDRSSPQYEARQKLEEAQQILAEDRPLVAIGILMDVIHRGYFVERATADLRRAVEPLLEHANLQRRLQAYTVLSHHVVAIRQHLPKFLERGVDRALKDANQFAEAQPEQGLKIIRHLQVIDPDHEELAALHRKLLQRAVVVHPEKSQPAIELALIYEQNEQLDDAAELLKRYRKQLGISEGARLLGQISLSEGEYEGAFQLLRPYVRSKMRDLRSTEREYTNTLNQVYDAALKHLDGGKAPESWYRRYDLAATGDQRKMVDEFANEFLKNDPRFRQAAEKMEKANQFVGVALDLGIAQLHRAQEMPDPAARKKALHDARRTFVSIQGFAGQSNDYLLFMGQVNYWLGNAAEGRAQFEQLIEQTQKAFDIVLAVAHNVREVGEDGWARELAEQAYTSTIKTAEMYRAARLRALLHTDNDDQIKWLELSDPEAADTIISLNTAKGRKAMADENTEAATKYFREAVRGYEKLPRNASSLNNKGLAYMDLYSVSGSVEEYMHGVKLLQEAAKLDPDDAILVGNSSSVSFTAAFFESLTNHYDFSILRTQPEIGMLSALYRNDAEREQVHARLRKSEWFRAGMSRLERSMVLSPKRLHGYLFSLGLYRTMRDLAGLKRLQQQIETAQPDAAAMKEKYLRGYAPDEDVDKAIDSLQASLLAVQEKLGQVKAPMSPTSEYLRAQELLVQLSIARETTNSTVGGLVTNARRLVQDFNNREAWGVLSHALNLQVLREFLAKYPDNEQLDRQTRNLFSPTQFLVYIMENRAGPEAEFIRRHAAAKESARLFQKIEAAFPDRASPHSWSFIRHFDKASADQLAASLKQDEISRLADELQLRLIPFNESAVQAMHFRALAAGDEAGAKQIWNNARQRGIPFPQL